MTSIAPWEPADTVIVGVDTHKHVHVAVAIGVDGQLLGEFRIPVDSTGYRELDHWAQTLGRLVAFGIEDTGSYGVGLASYLRRQGRRVVEVNRVIAARAGRTA